MANKHQTLVDFNEFLIQISEETSDETRKFIREETFSFNVLEPKVLKDVETYLRSSEVNGRLIYNYLTYRFISKLSQFFPEVPKKSEITLMEEEFGRHLIGKKPSLLTKKIPDPWPTPMPDEGEMNSFADDSQKKIERTCASFVMNKLDALSSRLFIDQVLPDLKEREEFKNDVTIIVTKVLDGFQV